MDIFQKYKIKPMQILKVGGLTILTVLVVAFVFRMVGTSVNSLVGQKGGSGVGLGIGGSMPSGMPESDASYGVDLSYRNVAPIMPVPPGTTPGNDAEAFEVTDYSATIETRELAETCGALAGLKAKSYVIFENANEYDRGCNYSFKVENARVEEILNVLKGFDPKQLVQNTYTIKRQINDFTNEEEILAKKRASIDETLTAALKAYDEITKVAILARDAQSLALIIDSKIRIIERLTQERINIDVQLDRLGRAKAEQLDRLNYTYFRVNVVEDKFVDGKLLKDDWKAAIKQFVYDVNNSIQDITIGLVALLFVILQYGLYLLILLVVAKYGWQLAKKIWNN